MYSTLDRAIMHSVIEQLQHKQLIWQGSLHRGELETSTSGHEELDNQLNGGFPNHGVVEITSPSGIGELCLLTPYIKEAGKSRLSVFINPPGYLCADYFMQQNMALDRIILIFPKTETEALWSAEQCLKSGCSGSVTLWHPALEVHQAKRLQVASEAGKCLHFLFKTDHKQRITLPVSLSLELQPKSNGLQVSVNKRKGGWLQRSFFIDARQHWPYLARQEHTDSVIPFPILKRGNA